MNDTATQQGAAPSQQPVDPDVDTSTEAEVKRSPRDIALAAMGERQEEMRRAELQEALESDPGLAYQQQAIENEIDKANAEAGIVHEQEPPADADGAASRQAMHESTPEQKGLPANLKDDPLAEFIEMHDGVPMVPQIVNGEKRLLTLDGAKRQLQIGTAAEVRMQHAAEAERRLKEREARIAASEAALQARTQQAQTQRSVPAEPDLTEEDLLKEATDIFETAFSGTEEDAAKKLAKTLAKIKASSTARPAPQIDQAAIARQAASLAMGTLTAQSRKKDVQTGYQDFKKNYSEIVADPQLFKMADDMTDNIEREHPDWSVAQIMDEAGKRTRAWVKGITGQTDTGDKPPQNAPSKDQNSHVSDSTTQTRQERKAGLVRMPQSAGAAVYSEPEERSENDTQSPQDAFRELKAARGQPV